jgi:hypothetical protein
LVTSASRDLRERGAYPDRRIRNNRGALLRIDLPGLQPVAHRKDKLRGKSIDLALQLVRQRSVWGAIAALWA